MLMEKWVENQWCCDARRRVSAAHAKCEAAWRGGDTVAGRSGLGGATAWCASCARRVGDEGSELYKPRCRNSPSYKVRCSQH